MLNLYVQDEFVRRELIMMDHILGALYGMALGDAMGMPSELLSRRRIREISDRLRRSRIAQRRIQLLLT